MRQATLATANSERAGQPHLAALPVLSASSLIGSNVCNLECEDLGSIEEIMLDTSSGKVRYAVLSSGGFLGIGDRLFAVPWSALKIDVANERFVLDVDVDCLRAAPGFDKDQWPDMSDSKWATRIHSYYGARTVTPRS